MSFTTDDIAKILAQPGYSIAPGSLWNPQDAPRTPETALNGAVDAKHVPDAIRTPVCPSTAFWRNEWEFQAAVVAEARRRASLQPEYALLVAIPNGQYRKGQRAEAGLTPGMPDLVLLVQRGGHGALFIELKCASNKPSAAQREMLYRLRMEGYRCEVVWDSTDEVMGIIEDYLRGGDA